MNIVIVGFLGIAVLVAFLKAFRIPMNAYNFVVVTVGVFLIALAMFDWNVFPAAFSMLRHVVGWR